MNIDVYYLTVTIFCNAVIGFFASGVLYLFARRYKHDFLNLWALGWFLLAMFGILGAIILSMRSYGNFSPAVYSALSIGSQLSGFIAPLFFYNGTRKVLNRSPLSSYVLLFSFVALIGWVALSTSMFSGTGDQLIRFVVRVGVRSLFSGVILLICAVMILGVYRSDPKTGPRLFGWSLLLYGLVQISYCVASIELLLGGKAGDFLSSSGFITFGLQVVMIYSTITWVVEIEQEKYRNAENRLRELAWKDSLTNLHNRRWFELNGQRALDVLHGQGKEAAVVFIDLDGFKRINDDLGHRIGDELLVHVAAVLQQQLRDDDMVCRLGGDEFVQLWVDIKSRDEVLARANQLREVIMAIDSIAGHSISISCSIGVSLYPAEQNQDLASLTSRSDRAMYVAKNKGRNAVIMADEAVA